MENFINDLAGFVWTWNVPILVGSGIFFLLYSKLTPFKYLKHAFELILGRHSKQDDVGDVTHFQALTTALSGHRNSVSWTRLNLLDVAHCNCWYCN